MKRMIMLFLLLSTCAPPAFAHDISLDFKKGELVIVAGEYRK